MRGQGRDLRARQIRVYTAKEQIRLEKLFGLNVGDLSLGSGPTDLRKPGSQAVERTGNLGVAGDAAFTQEPRPRNVFWLKKIGVSQKYRLTTEKPEVQGNLGAKRTHSRNQNSMKHRDRPADTSKSTGVELFPSIQSTAAICS